MISGEKQVHGACVQAIIRRRVVEFDYQGHGRAVVPMTVGMDHAGRLKLRGQQTGGSSSKGKPDPNDPRLFFLDRITDLLVTETPLDVPPLYTTGDTAFKRIDAGL